MHEKMHMHMLALLVVVKRVKKFNIQQIDVHSTTYSIEEEELPQEAPRRMPLILGTGAPMRLST